MPLISDTDFLRMQALLGQGYDGLALAEVTLQSGFSIVVASADVDVELDLLYPFEQNMDAMVTQSSSNYLRVATLALEQHTQNETGQNFNDYLYTRSLKVTPSFALLSGYLGVTINPLNIA